ncbi:aromatic compound dioxygenase [Colletotrichum asianum]
MNGFNGILILTIFQFQCLALKSRSVDTHGDVADHSVLDVLAVQGNDLDDGAVAADRALVEQAQRVLDVLGAVDLGVRDVGLKGHDLSGDVLFEVDLASVDQVTGADGAVGADRPCHAMSAYDHRLDAGQDEKKVNEDLGVDVDGSLDVEAGEDGLHLHDALRVGGPHASEEGGVVGVEVSDADLEIGNVQLVEQLHEPRVRAQVRERRVAAGRVAVPKRDESVRERLAGGHVEDADIERQGDADLAFGHVHAQSLRARPDVGALGDLRGQDAGVVLDCDEVDTLSVDHDAGVASARLQLGRALGHALGLSFLVELGSLSSAALRHGITTRDLGAGEDLVVGQGGGRQETGGQERAELHSERVDARERMTEEIGERGRSAMERRHRKSISREGPEALSTLPYLLEQLRKRTFCRRHG